MASAHPLPCRALLLMMLVLSMSLSGAGLAFGEASLPLVFVHGIKGAELQDADGSVAWLTGWQALGLATPDLRLAPRFDGGVQPGGALHPGGVLAAVRIVPHLFEVDVYRPFLQAAAGFGQPFHPFAYDWRRDNLESAAALESFLGSVRAAHGGARVQVVAHSMGGLLTLAVLRRRPELFDAVVFAGVPFGGGIGFLPDLTEGDATGLNKRLLAPEVLATFPSVFTLFPLTAGASLTDRRGQPLAVDFFAAADWRRLKLGPYAGATLPDGYDTFFETALARARRFRELLTKGPVSYPRILVVAGRSQATLAQARQGGDQAERGWDFRSEPPQPGDSRVVYERAFPPADIPHETLETAAEHSQLLNDAAVITAVKAFLQGPPGPRPARPP